MKSMETINLQIPKDPTAEKNARATRNDRQNRYEQVVTRMPFVRQYRRQTETVTHPHKS